MWLTCKIRCNAGGKCYIASFKRRFQRTWKRGGVIHVYIIPRRRNKSKKQFCINAIICWTLKKDAKFWGRNLSIKTKMESKIWIVRLILKQVSLKNLKVVFQYLNHWGSETHEQHFGIFKLHTHTKKSIIKIAIIWEINMIWHKIWCNDVRLVQYTPVFWDFVISSQLHNENTGASC